MNNHVVASDVATVEVESNCVVIRNLMTEDQYLADYLHQVEPAKRADAVRATMRVGVRILSADMNAVTLNQMRETLRSHIEEIDRESQLIRTIVEDSRKGIATAFETVWREHFGNGNGAQGKVQVALSRFQEGFLTEWEKRSASLLQKFDEESTKGIPARLEKLLNDTLQAQLTSFVASLRVDSEDNPFREWMGGIDDKLEAFGTSVRKQLVEISEKVAAARDVAEEKKKGTRKGNEFNDLVFAALSDCAWPMKDRLEDVRDETSASGKKSGDALVTVEEGASAFRVVFEVRDRDSGSDKAALDDLTKAMVNRDAVVGVLVKAKESQPPRDSGPIKLYPGQRIVCTLDKEDGNNLALRIAYQLAREIARRMMKTPDATRQLDSAAVLERINRLQADLSRLKAPIGCINAISRKADEAANGIREYEDAAMATLRELIAMVRDAE